MVRRSSSPKSSAILLHIFLCSITLASLSSCTSKNESSNVQITIPKITKSFSLSVSTMSGGDEFGLPDPANLSDFDCFGLFVGANEPGLNQNRAYDDAGNLIFNFGPLVGLAGQGQTLKASVMSGPDRTLTIVGFDLVPGQVCETFTETSHELNASLYSPPFILSQKTVSLSPGDSAPISMQLSYSANSVKLGDLQFANGSGGGNNSSVQLGNGADGDQTFTTSTPLDLTALTYTNAAGLNRKFTAYRRVTNISGTGPYTLSITAASIQEFAPGDEIMMYIIGSSPGGPPSDCGDVYPGFKIPGRVAAYVPATSSIQINFGEPRIATIPNANLAASAVSGGPFCRAMIVRVPNFKNLSFNFSGSGQVYVPSVGTLNSGSHGGGIIVFRVQEALTSQGSVGSISTKGSGFIQSPGGKPGQSVLGYVSTPSNSPLNSGGGGSVSPADYPGGGGHGGAGGGGTSANGGNIEGDQYGCSVFDIDRKCLLGKMFMGAAGGTHTSSASATGAGGGVIAIYANKLVVPVSKTLTLNSDALLNSSIDDGGSAGGSILIRANEVSLGGNLNLSANGESSNNAGAGGGGRVHLDVNQVCNTVSSTSISLSVNGGTGTSNGANGTKFISGPGTAQVSCQLPTL